MRLDLWRVLGAMRRRSSHSLREGCTLPSALGCTRLKAARLACVCVCVVLPGLELVTDSMSQDAHAHEQVLAFPLLPLFQGGDLLHGVPAELECRPGERLALLVNAECSAAMPQCTSAEIECLKPDILFRSSSTLHCQLSSSSPLGISRNKMSAVGSMLHIPFGNRSGCTTAPPACRPVANPLARREAEPVQLFVRVAASSCDTADVSYHMRQTCVKFVLFSFDLGGGIIAAQLLVMFACRFDEAWLSFACSSCYQPKKPGLENVEREVCHSRSHQRRTLTLCL